MSTHSEKNTRNIKKREHLFASLGTCIPPVLNTRVHTLRELIDFGDIKPCNIFSVYVSFREHVDNRVSGFRNREGCRCGRRRITFIVFVSPVS
jgi:hypothetical protein